jgi:alkylated DNA nucleotide flippase Atl1
MTNELYDPQRLASKMSMPEAEVIKAAPHDWAARFGGNRMLISTPVRVAEVVATIPPGQTLTLSELRARLAAEAGADFTCPLTTGLFLRTVAEAHEAGVVNAPWWRVLPDKGKLNDKLPGGGQLQRERLNAEGNDYHP